MRIIDTRHEQAAAAMADAWTRVTGKPAVVVVTALPAVVAMVSGIKNAEFSPVISIAGKTDLSRLDVGLSHEMDQIALMSPITKWAKTVYETKRIPEYVASCFRQALAGQPGPVFLDLPRDIVETTVEDDTGLYPRGYRTDARTEGDPGLVKKALELLQGAERPLVVGGSGLWWAQAGRELREFLELTGLPFSLGQRKGKGRGILPEDHPLFVGPARASSKRADVILALGIWPNSRLGGEKTKTVQVDVDQRAIGQNMPVDIGIVGDAGMVLRQMIEFARKSWKPKKDSTWLEECRAEDAAWRESLETQAKSDAVPIHPGRLWKEVRDYLDRDAIVTVDGGEITSWVRSYFKAYLPGHLLDDSPRGCLGTAIPFGIGAKLASPKSQVLVCTGDGAFGINGMEFDTAVRQNIPFVAVVANNGCWGRCRTRQYKLFHREVGVELGFTRYDRVVEALGGHGEWVERPEEIRPALARAFASGKPACLNVKIDRSIKPPADGGE